MQRLEQRAYSAFFLNEQVNKFCHVTIVHCPSPIARTVRCLSRARTRRIYHAHCTYALPTPGPTLPVHGAAAAFVYYFYVRIERSRKIYVDTQLRKRQPRPR
jgi:hypothetical protein